MKAPHFTLQRKFTRNFDFGGRLYCAFVNSPRMDKPYRLIDGQPTVAADYSSPHFRLACAVAELGEFDGDPFAFKGASRADCKAVCNALINVKTRRGEQQDEAAGKALRDEARRSDTRVRPVDAYKVRGAAVRQALIRRHPEVCGLFGSGLGLRLQRADSEMDMAMVEAFTRAGRPLVAEHDGFRLLQQDRQLLEATKPLADAAMLRNSGAGAVKLPLKWS